MNEAGEEWLAVDVWAIEREKVGRKIEDGREDNVRASNKRRLHTSSVEAQAEPGHGTPAFQERGPHPNTPAPILHATYKRKQQVLTSRGKVVAYTRYFSWVLSKIVGVPEVWLAITGLNGK